MRCEVPVKINIKIMVFVMSCHMIIISVQSTITRLPTYRTVLMPTADK